MSSDTIRALMGLIVFLVAQLGGGIWWASNVTNRVEQLEQEMTQTVTADRRLLVIETVLPDLKTLLQSIDNRLRKLEENGQRGLR